MLATTIKPKRACVSCGKSDGQLFREANTRKIVCSIGCGQNVHDACASDVQLSINGEIMNLSDTDRRYAFIRVWEELIDLIDDNKNPPQIGHPWFAANTMLRKHTKVVQNVPFIPEISIGSTTFHEVQFPGLYTALNDMLLEAKNQIDVGKRRANLSLRVAVLNMASANHAGGGVRRGALNAQEEDLCRRTNLMMSISPEYNPHGWPYGYHIPEHGAIFSPGVKVLRADREQDFAWLTANEIFQVDVISAAAVNISRIPEERRDRLRWLGEMRPRALAVLYTALVQKANVLVIAPWGAGAFGAKPAWTGELFAHAIIDVFSYLSITKEENFLNKIAIVSTGSASLREMSDGMSSIFTAYGLNLWM